VWGWSGSRGLWQGAGGMASSTRFRPGERVVYHDLDQVQWGPWLVTRVAGSCATVEVDGLLELSLEAGLLRRAGRDSGAA